MYIYIYIYIYVWLLNADCIDQTYENFMNYNTPQWISLDILLATVPLHYYACIMLQH